MNTLGRYILRALLWNYIITVAVMLSLYVLLDLFVNMDEFTEHGRKVSQVIADIADYYAPNLLLYFKQLSGVIMTFACLATAARMRKQNELTAMLASGVSLFRLAIPIVGFGLATIALMVITTEWIIPKYAHKLARDHDDVGGGQTYDVLFMSDRGGALVSAGRFDTRAEEMNRLLVLTRDEDGRIIESVEADRATWQRDPSNPSKGHWRLERAKQRSRMRSPEGGLGPQGAVVESYPVVYDSDLSPEVIQLRQREGWIEFLSLAQLNEIEPRDNVEASAILRTKQARVTTPIISMILLLLGLPFFLNRAPASVLSETGKCTLFCGTCYVISFLAQSIRAGELTSLVTWAPIFAFAVIAMVRLDRIRT